MRHLPQEFGSEYPQPPLHQNHLPGHTSALCDTGGFCFTACGPRVSANKLSLRLAPGGQRIKAWHSLRNSEKKKAFLLSFFICFPINIMAVVLICFHTNCRFSTVMDQGPHWAIANWLCMTHGARDWGSPLCTSPAAPPLRGDTLAWGSLHHRAPPSPSVQKDGSRKTSSFQQHSHLQEPGKVCWAQELVSGLLELSPDGLSSWRSCL